MSVLGVLTALIAPTWETTRSLRKNLATDLEMAEHLPTGARGAMAAENARRAHILIARTRYPVLVRSDLLKLTAVAAIFVYAVVAGTDGVEPAEPSVAGVVVALTFFMGLMTWLCWAVNRSWCRRAIGRAEYLRPRIDLAELNERHAVTRTAVMSNLLAALFLGGMTSIFLLASQTSNEGRLQGSPNTLALGLFVAMGPFLVILGSFLRGSAAALWETTEQDRSPKTQGIKRWFEPLRH